jgi:hypothetical protein
MKKTQSRIVVFLTLATVLAGSVQFALAASPQDVAPPPNAPATAEWDAATKTVQWTITFSQ